MPLIRNVSPVQGRRASALARFLPNSISRSRLSADSFTLPSAVLSDDLTADFDRRGGFPTSCMSSSCRSIRSPNGRPLPAARGLDDPLWSMLRSANSSGALFAVTWRELLCCSYWTQEVAHFNLQPVALGGQRLRGRQHLGGRRSGLGGAALHVGDI